MLTRRYRPKTFAEMQGADLPRKALRKIAHHPDGAPQSIILAGSWGSGKSTSVRIFGRAVNCHRRDGDACNECESCKSIHDRSQLYNEYDSAVVGNVEMMRGLRESFGYTLQKGFRVINFDETHLCSKQAQSSLLTVLEEAPKGVFFVFSTTNPEAILDTIVSRSIVLEFEPLGDDDVRTLLKHIAVNENIELSERVMEYIVRRVRGHARDAVQQLEMLRLLGEKDFVAQGVFLESMFEELMKLFQERKLPEAKTLINRIVRNPLVFIEQDFGIYIRRIADGVFLTEQAVNKRLKDLVFFYLKNHKLLRTTSDWYLFLSAIATLFEERQQVANASSRFSK